LSLVYIGLTNGEALYWKIPMRISVDFPNRQQDENLLGFFPKNN